jgi:hypothetical protein
MSISHPKGGGQEPTYHWYSIRRVIQLHPGSFEERITVWYATSFEEAFEMSEAEAADYAADLDGEDLGMAQGYRADLDLGQLHQGMEILSLIRDAALDGQTYIHTYFLTGTEHEGAVSGPAPEAAAAQFHDQSGVEEQIQLPQDPRDGIPPDVVDALESAILGQTFEIAMSVLDWIQLLIEDDDDYQETGDLAAWLNTTAPPDQTSMPKAEKVLATRSIAKVIQESVGGFSRRERVVLIESLRDLEAEWGALLTDDEKLAGHLAMHHRATLRGELDPGRLLALHRSLHGLDSVGAN